MRRYYWLGNQHPTTNASEYQTQVLVCGAVGSSLRSTASWPRELHYAEQLLPNGAKGKHATVIPVWYAQCDWHQHSPLDLTIHYFKRSVALVCVAQVGSCCSSCCLWKRLID